VTHRIASSPKYSRLYIRLSSTRSQKTGEHRIHYRRRTILYKQLIRRHDKLDGLNQMLRSALNPNMGDPCLVFAHFFDFITFPSSKMAARILCLSSSHPRFNPPAFLPAITVAMPSLVQTITPTE